MRTRSSRGRRSTRGRATGSRVGPLAPVLAWAESAAVAVAASATVALPARTPLSAVLLALGLRPPALRRVPTLADRLEADLALGRIDVDDLDRELVPVRTASSTLAIRLPRPRR